MTACKGRSKAQKRTMSAIASLAGREKIEHAVLIAQKHAQILSDVKARRKHIQVEAPASSVFPNEYSVTMAKANVFQIN